MKTKILVISLLIFNTLLLSLIGVSALEERVENASSCPDELISRIDDTSSPIHPISINVTPWQGRHQVYGIFMLPEDAKTVKGLMVSIPGSGSYCGSITGVGKSLEGVKAKDGHYLVKANLRTRTSIWLMVKGFSDQLQQIQSWQLL